MNLSNPDGRPPARYVQIYRDYNWDHTLPLQTGPNLRLAPTSDCLSPQTDSHHRLPLTWCRCRPGPEEAPSSSFCSCRWCGVGCACAADSSPSAPPVRLSPPAPASPAEPDVTTDSLDSQSARRSPLSAETMKNIGYRKYVATVRIELYLTLEPPSTYWYQRLQRSQQWPSWVCHYSHL